MFFILVYHQDRHLVVIGDEITISSKKQLSLNIIFTLSRWAHFVTMLKDIYAEVK